jgi:hypothetical protein
MTTEFSINDMKQRIYSIRGLRMMLDADLASLYQIPTGRLNEQVQRNARRFPPDFMFRLTSDEYEILKTQNGFSRSTHGGRRYLPFAFTEHGATMIASVLNNDRAVQVNIAIVRAFGQRTENQPPQGNLDSHDFALRIELQYTQIAKEIREINQRLLAFSFPQNVEVGRLPHPSEPQESSVTRGPRYKVEAIQNAVAKYYSLKVQDLKTLTRRKTIAVPRQIAMYLIREKVGLGYREIGAFFGGKDHTTILHACRKIETALQRDSAIREAVDTIQNSV